MNTQQTNQIRTRIERDDTIMRLLSRKWQDMASAPSAVQDEYKGAEARLYEAEAILDAYY